MYTFVLIKLKTINQSELKSRVMNLLHNICYKSIEKIYFIYFRDCYY